MTVVAQTNTNTEPSLTTPLFILQKQAQFQRGKTSVVLKKHLFLHIEGKVDKTISIFLTNTEPSCQPSQDWSDRVSVHASLRMLKVEIFGLDVQNQTLSSMVMEE